MGSGFQEGGIKNSECLVEREREREREKKKYKLPAAEWHYFGIVILLKIKCFQWYLINSPKPKLWKIFFSKNPYWKQSNNIDLPYFDLKRSKMRTNLITIAHEYILTLWFLSIFSIRRKWYIQVGPTKHIQTYVNHFLQLCIDVPPPIHRRFLCRFPYKL